MSKTSVCNKYLKNTSNNAQGNKKEQIHGFVRKIIAFVLKNNFIFVSVRLLYIQRKHNCSILIYLFLASIKTIRSTSAIKIDNINYLL